MVLKKNSGTNLKGKISVIRKIIKKTLLESNSFRGHEKEKGHVLELIRRTVNMGESNSVLIIGPRGCGKTTLLYSALTEIRKEKKFYKKALIVELHGLVHTDDRLALKDATKQLQLENMVGNKVFGSFAENLSYLLQCLKSGNKEKSKSIIFILDEFDLFCSHHNQTLLYNLFDIAQSAQAPICVIGLTCRLDVTELLEKRVKSRFSHRQIFLFHNNDFLARMKLLQEILSVPEEVKELDKVLIDSWNNQIEELCAEKKVKDVMSKLFNVDNSERTFKSFLIKVVSKLSENHETLIVEDFVQEYKLWTRDAKIAMMEGLSVLELCLVIAMKHQTEIYDGEPLNFEMVYRRYLKFASQNHTVQNVERPVVLKAFEHLKSMEFVVPLSASQNNILKEYQLHRFHLTSEQDEGVKLYQGLPTEVEQWAASSYQ
ncbi:hypothetical protein L9F63_010666 [Diploptera punctata]|uniref:Origin recognition complex subunit 4 n=1 Tax=Diploptera punctata TaxID=6984 RepID=A0AAD8AHE5_DIPPU|nr:hypothetical protein L9F63_010666 [Diploptera punctata]